MSIDCEKCSLGPQLCAFCTPPGYYRGVVLFKAGRLVWLAERGRGAGNIRQTESVMSLSQSEEGRGGKCLKTTESGTNGMHREFLHSPQPHYGSSLRPELKLNVKRMGLSTRNYMQIKIYLKEWWIWFSCVLTHPHIFLRTLAWRDHCPRASWVVLPFKSGPGWDLQKNYRSLAEYPPPPPHTHEIAALLEEDDCSS